MPGPFIYIPGHLFDVPGCLTAKSSLRKQGPDIRAFTPVFNGLCSRALSIGGGVWVPAP